VEIDIKIALDIVVEHGDLTNEQMTAVMRAIMNGQTTPAQTAGFLIALRMKKETVEEITAAVQVMREFATPVNVDGPHLVDIVGTGGDGQRTFNISTTSAFVVAAAGGKVAKHGNRSVSSQSGSADVLESLGVKINLTPEQVARCVNEVGLGFMFAPLHHSAMKHALGPRREIGIRTLFNLLGPLTNPANTPNQLVGVFSRAWLEPIAHVLNRLHSQHILVVHSEDGLDEISIAAPTTVTELKNGQITTYTITPETFGLQRAGLETIQVNSVADSVALVHQVLANQANPARDIVVLNAGAAIYAANLVDNLTNGIKRAQEVLANGDARDKLTNLIQLTQSFS
jgi:anthranilate phosphoribosyltransferase